MEFCILPSNSIVNQINRITNGRLAKMLEDISRWQPSNKKELHDKNLVYDTIEFLILGHDHRRNNKIKVKSYSYTPRHSPDNINRTMKLMDKIYSTKYQEKN